MVAGLEGVTKIPELRKRIIFTFGMLAVYRFGVFVPTPGIDVAALRRMFDTGDGTLFGLVNMFSGGAFKNFSIFTLGIMPYISVSIILQMMASSIPALERLKKEGEAGQRVITRYTRQGTVLLALFQGYIISVGLEGQGLVLNPGLSFRLTTMITLTAGTSFIMWLGEQINEKGIGNGMSVVIFAGIIARMPQTLVSAIVLARTGEVHPVSVLLILVFSVLTIAGIVFVERCHRRIPVQYPRRAIGKKVAQAQTQYMPLKVNMAGVMPPILAGALLVVPFTAASFSSNETLQEILSYISPSTWVYNVIYAFLLFFFGYFYVGLTYNANEVADNLKKNGGFIPTVRPGKQTAEYLFTVLNRLTLWGGVYMCVVCIIPRVFYFDMGIQSFAYIFGGTAILIVVGVVLDTASQIESHVVARNYESFMSKSSKVRGGLGSLKHSRKRLLRR